MSSKSSSALAKFTVCCGLGYCVAALLGDLEADLRKLWTDLKADD